MEALAYLREKNRMTNTCQIECRNCPISSKNSIFVGCSTLEQEFPEDCVQIVEKWAKEHPPKTYAQDFLEKFPNAPKNIDGTPIACKKNIYCGRCITKCPDCWNSPMEET